jgi:GTP-dependent dephospho-CoA kinase
VDLRPRHAFELPTSLRAALAAPFGPIVQTDELAALLAGHPVAAVGDVVSMTLHELGIQPVLFVCDYKTQRHDDPQRFRRTLSNWGDRVARVRNPPATITRAAWDAVRDAFALAGTTRIEVDGEEDLLGIPVILEAPLGTRFIYGMPERGVVVVAVDGAMKVKAAELVDGMTAANA